MKDINKDDLTDWVSSIKSEARRFATTMGREAPVKFDKWLNPADFTAVQKCVGLQPKKEVGRTFGITWNDVNFHCTMGGSVEDA